MTKTITCFHVYDDITSPKLIDLANALAQQQLQLIARPLIFVLAPSMMTIQKQRCQQDTIHY